MMHEPRFEEEFFRWGFQLDGQIAGQVAAAGCPHCGGALHRGNYRRKPRGALLAEPGEAFTLRHSLCCGRRGCRKRALPPSLRFLGRRVYLEVVVLLASALAQMMGGVEAAIQATGVCRRTLRRWGAWWTTTFPGLSLWTELRARFVPPAPDEATLPSSLVLRLEVELSEQQSQRKVAVTDVAGLAARLLAPATTLSVRDGARFLRGLVGPDGPDGFTQSMLIAGVLASA